MENIDWKILESKPIFHSNFDHSLFKDKILIMVATHWHLDLIKKSFKSILDIVEKRDDVYLTVIDNASESPIKTYLKTLKNKRVEINFVDENLGRAAVFNNYLKTYVNESNLPEIIVVIDPDITFSIKDFEYLVQGVKNLPKIGMLSMRYKKNICNPESNLFFRPKNMKGKDGNLYHVSLPFMSNVAGGIFGIKGRILPKDLNYRIFPKKIYDVYAFDDASLHDVLKRKGYKNGYLNGTEATHHKSGAEFISD
ncbi:MAG: glycosyltransferase [Candidatus Margulisbacteria bacterium]|nr:glycosyltransferase [Candidatus Margulisiibacteriota bacterium]